MSLYQKIQDDMRSSMKAQDRFRTNLLKLVLADADRLGFSSTRGKTTPLDDAEVQKVIRKIVEGNTETISKLKEGDSRITNLKEENLILNEFLPVVLSLIEVRASTQTLAPLIEAARSEGEAIGIVMKYFKTTGEAVNGDDVKNCVKSIRLVDKTAKLLNEVADKLASRDVE